MINLLRRLLGHNDKFFDLLETSAGEDHVLLVTREALIVSN